MGAVYTPIWVDPPMFYSGNERQIAVGNVFFLHMILANSDNQHAMTLGHSMVVGEHGPECLSRSSLDLVVNHG
jgi:Xaa-Pro dipeptidase